MRIVSKRKLLNAVAENRCTLDRLPPAVFADYDNVDDVAIAMTAAEYDGFAVVEHGETVLVTVDYLHGIGSVADKDVIRQTLIHDDVYKLYNRYQTLANDLNDAAIELEHEINVQVSDNDLSVRVRRVKLFGCTIYGRGGTGSITVSQ